MNPGERSRALIEAVEDLLERLEGPYNRMGDLTAPTRRVRDALAVVVVEAPPPAPAPAPANSVLRPSMGRIVHVFVPQLRSTLPGVVFSTMEDGLRIGVTLLGPRETSGGVVEEYQHCVAHLSMLSEKEVMDRWTTYWMWPERA